MTRSFLPRLDLDDLDDLADRCDLNDAIEGRNDDVDWRGVDDDDCAYGGEGGTIGVGSDELELEPELASVASAPRKDGDDSVGIEGHSPLGPMGGRGKTRVSGPEEPESPLCRQWISGLVVLPWPVVPALCRDGGTGLVLTTEKRGRGGRVVGSTRHRLARTW